MGRVAARADGSDHLMQQAGELQRIRYRVTGAVQGVGFRPFVYRLATRLDLAGWVSNDPGGVTIEVEGSDEALAGFGAALRSSAPPSARVHAITTEPLEADGVSGFRIMGSSAAGDRTAVVLPDLATCADCLADVRNAAGRRAGYALTNCTNCGPRFSIIQALPYDRPNTTMARFVMCDACAAEYGDPLDRRFHAQPNACPECGPRLALWDCYGTPQGIADPLDGAVAAILRGEVVAVKGLGGFHLAVDATNDAAVAQLRRRKKRPTKPLAVMVSSVEDAARFVTVSPEAATLLQSPEAPIVLLPRRALAGRLTEHMAPALAAEIAPHNPFIGVMLAATPLHHLLLQRCGVPLVATSGNLSEEPICTSEHDALVRLAGIADAFLVHDRPIERHVDDSVADLLDGSPRLLRRARGYAPLPVLVAQPLPTILAVGAHMKNVVALTRGRQVFLSQHIGDLDARESLQAFERVARDLVRLYEAEPVALAHDAHPDYASTLWARAYARTAGVRAIAVQHHHAHLAACMAENGVSDRCLGIVWDGTGYGPDGTIWGGEFLVGDASGFQRAAHLLPFHLPGGDAAVREPRRVAASLVMRALGQESLRSGAHPALGSFSAADRANLLRMMQRGLNAPVTTSAGRLFDGIAALLGLCGIATFEGEAAIRLEHAVDAGEGGAYDMPALPGVAADAPVALDWRAMVCDVVADHRRGVATGVIAARVHNAMIAAMAMQAEIVGCDTVALSGGCFFNRVLASGAAAALRRRGFRVLTHRQVPAGDGGIALGQAVIAAAVMQASPGAAGSASTITSSA